MKKHLLSAIFVSVALSAASQGDFVKQTDSLNPIVTFGNIGSYRGAAWVDINDDGLVDFHAAPGFLFMNSGGGQFVAVTNPMNSGTPNPQGFASCSWADYDHDGDIDCFIGSRVSRLYINDGQGNFMMNTGVFATLKDYTGWAAALGDANNDAKMDICIAYANGFHPGTPLTPCLYLVGDSAGLLHEENGYAFTDSLAPYTVPYWSDYDLDGDLDLFIASGPAGTPGYDYCYRNLLKETGADSLERMVTETFASDMQDGQCYNFIDYDCDGDRDLCITNYGGASSRLYRNDSGIYIPVTTPFTTTGSRLANCWGDYDNDGDEDVIISSDGAFAKYYRNDGNDQFVEETFDMSSKFGGSGVANADIDNDGDLDAFIMGTGTAKGLYINDGIAGNNHWLNIRCTGTVSNQSAIGTLIRVKATINGQQRWQLREISAMNSFMGHNDLRVHVGLGDAAVADSVIIRYLSGITEIFTNVSSNSFYENVEGSGMLNNITSLDENPAPAHNYTVAPNPSSASISVYPAAGIKAYSIKDIKGSEIMGSKMHKGDTLHIDISKLKTGSYFLLLEENDAVNKIVFIKD